MDSFFHNMYLLYTKGFSERCTQDQPAAITSLQTDDILTIANESFIYAAKSMVKRFQSKPSKYLPENLANCIRWNEHL